MKITVIVVIPPAPPGDKQPFAINQEQPAPVPCDPGQIRATCDVCGWTSCYPTAGKARMGLSAHRQWCKRGHGKKVFW